MKPIVFFDLETTGTNVSNDRIVQIAAVKVFISDDVIIREELKRAIINPCVPIPAGATKVHGITDEDVKDAPTFSQYAKGLMEYLSGCDLGGFNSIRFDVPLLMAEFERCGMSFSLDGVNLIDAYTIFSKKEERTLSAALKFYCGKEMVGAHDAGNDIIATVDVFESQLNYYEDLQNMTVEELHNFCGGDSRVDIGGYLGYDDERNIIFTFGKHRGAKVLDQMSYAQWMIGSDFPRDTKRILIDLTKSNR